MVAYDIATKFQVTTNPARAREIMEKRIEAGRASALNLFERINTDVPADAICKGSALRFGTRAKTIEVLGRDVPQDTPPDLIMGYGDQGVTIHKHALSQLATRAGVPGAYLAELATGGHEWQRRLAAGILNEHFHKGEPHSRYLVRAVRKEARGVLSDKFRRLDNRPLLERLASAAQALGAVPIDGSFSDTRIAIKVILPDLFEPVPGEVLAFGLEWGNSDFGAAMHSVRAFLLRVWCLNGATMENTLQQVHLGGRISDDVELSQKTYALDTRTSMSALDDVVRGTLSPKKVEQLCAGIQRANENKVEWKNVSSGLAKKLLKSELEAARQAFDSEDVVNLPPVHSMWRVSNAISWIAGKAEDADRRLELQRLAGEMVDGKADIKTVSFAA